MMQKLVQQLERPLTLKEPIMLGTVIDDWNYSPETGLQTETM